MSMSLILPGVFCGPMTWMAGGAPTISATGIFSPRSLYFTQFLCASPPVWINHIASMRSEAFTFTRFWE